jgi:hypothetical protein
MQTSNSFWFCIIFPGAFPKVELPGQRKQKNSFMAFVAYKVFFRKTINLECHQPSINTLSTPQTCQHWGLSL